jgi:hypothetical protein
MKVKFLTNLGSTDARQLGVDHTECREGMTCEVSPAAGRYLLDRGHAVEVEVKAIPPMPAITAPYRDPAPPVAKVEVAEAPALPPEVESDVPETKPEQPVVAAQPVVSKSKKEK